MCKDRATGDLPHPDGWERCPGAQISADGRFAVFAEGRNEGSRLQLVQLNNGLARTVIEAPFRLAHPLMNPRRAQILYRQGNEALWFCECRRAAESCLAFERRNHRAGQLALQRKDFPVPQCPRDPSQLSAIREFAPDHKNQDQDGRAYQPVCAFWV